MSRKGTSTSEDTKAVLRALRRAARKALELGVQTGTPVYIWKNGKIVDLTKDKAATARIRSKLIKKLRAGR